MSAIPEFLCEDVAAVGISCYVPTCNHVFFLLKFWIVVLVQVQVFQAFGCGHLGPVDAGTVVVVDDRGLLYLVHVEVASAKADGHSVLDAFVCGHDLQLGRAQFLAVLMEVLPGDGPPTSNDEVARHRAKLEERDLGAVGYQVS